MYAINELEALMGGYRHWTEGFERAMECTNPDCHHAEIDKKAAVEAYNAEMTKLCHRIVAVLEEMMTPCPK